MRGRSLTLLLLATACAPGASLQMGSETEMSTDYVPPHWAVQEVFERVGIPVSTVDESSGEIRSGTFTVGRLWDGDPVARRLECPRVGDVDRSRLYAAQFSVSVAARVRQMGASGARLQVSGEAVRQGDGGGSELGRVRCHLREPFRQWLMDEISRKSENLPAGPRTY